LAIKGIIQFAKIIFSGFLIGFLLYRIGIDRIAVLLISADLYWLFAAIFLFLTSHVIGSVQWHLLLKHEGVDIKWRKVLSFYFVGLFLNNFLLSSLGGDLFRMIDVKRYSKNFSGAVATVFLDRLAGFFLLSTLAVMSGPWIIIQRGFRSKLTLLILLLVVSWIVILFLLFNKRFARPFAVIFTKIVPDKLSLKAKEIYQKIYSFGREKSVIGKVLAVSCIIQSLRILTHYMIARSFGVSVSPVNFFLIVPVIAIVASLPVSFGGIGIREQTGVILFGMIGISAIKAFSIEFIAYIVAVIASLPGGVIFTIRRGVDNK